MNIAIRSFKGIAPKIEPRYLPDGAAQAAINVEAEGQSVRPLRQPGPLPEGITNELDPNPAFLYRFGQDVVGEQQYWFSDDKVVDACRSQIAGDPCEWTLLASPSFRPQVTNATLAIKDTPTGILPARQHLLKLGIPAPTQALSVDVPELVPEVTRAVLTLTPEILRELITYDFARNTPGFLLSLDKGVSWYHPTTLTVPNSPAPNKAGVVIDAADIAGMAWADGIDVSVDGGTTRTWFALTKSGETFSAADLVRGLNVNDPNGHRMVRAELAGTTVNVWSWVAGAKAGLELSWNLTAGGTAKKAGAGTALTAETVREALAGEFQLAGDPSVKRTGANYFDVAVTTTTAVDAVTLTTKEWCMLATGLPGGQTSPADCIADGGTWITNGEHRSLTFKWGAGYGQSKAATGTTEDFGTYESRTYAFTWIYKAGTDNSACPWTWESAPSPPSVIAKVYADSEVNLSRFYCALPTGTTLDPPPQNAAACADAQGTWTRIDPEFAAPGVPLYPCNGLRLYRAVAGQYLLVLEADIDFDDSPTGRYHTDTASADELGEPCPSLTWTPPPSRLLAPTDETTCVAAGGQWDAGSGACREHLSGIINLPNGMVAGFLGRDVYFCEPYRPFAWPENYVQTLDSPIVGLGRMDTTLAVLTKGAPYFIQGSEPGNMNVVKADLEQACVSRRSIVSMGRNVFYASPDGLVILFPGGSAVVTESLIRRFDWQFLQPGNIHAYGHDGKYIAFFGTTPLEPWGNKAGGFVYDMASKQFYLHGYSAWAGYTDLRNDTLYLATKSSSTAAPSLVKWGEALPAAVTPGFWRSKIFGMPQGTGFSCGQIESGPLTGRRDGINVPAYAAVTLRIFVDGVLFHAVTVPDSDYYDNTTRLLLSRRSPFRLPPLNKAYCRVDDTVDLTKTTASTCTAAGGTWVTSGFIGRDWVIELDVASEIFNVVLAQSMSEIASV